VNRNLHYLGIDVGSTTAKIVILNENDDIIYSRYERHLSNIKDTIVNLIDDAYSKFGDLVVSTAVTGSGGMAVSEWLNMPFVQEVIAGTKTVERFFPEGRYLSVPCLLLVRKIKKIINNIKNLLRNVKFWLHKKEFKSFCRNMIIEKNTKINLVHFKRC